MRLHVPFIKGILLTAGLLQISSLGHTETLQEIYALAVENDHEFKAAYAAYQSGVEAKSFGRSALLPKINGTASWLDSSTERSGTSTSETDNTNSGYRISVEQPLFDLAAWHNYKAGVASADIAHAQFKSDQQALIIRTAEAYFAALEAADNLRTSLAEEEALIHQLEQTRQRFEVGLSAITEVHEAQAVYDSSVADRLFSEGQVGITFEALQVLTGISHNQIAPLKDTFVASAPQPKARDAWVERALESNYILEMAKLNADSARSTAKSKKAEHYPKLSLSGSYSSFNDDTTLDGFQSGDVDTDNQTIGVTLSIPFYNGGAVSSSRRQAQQGSIQAREQYLKSRRDIVQSARSQHLIVATSVATVKARKQTIISTESALEATKAGYSVGTRDLVDVLRAQRGLYQAQRNYSTALYDYIIGSLRLKEVAGMLSESDISQLSAWLDIKNLVDRSSVSL